MPQMFGPEYCGLFVPLVSRFVCSHEVAGVSSKHEDFSSRGKREKKLAKNVNRGGSIKPSGSFFELEGECVSRYVWAAELVQGKDVLDSGCGSGYGTMHLAESGAKTVVGIDSDGMAIRTAELNYRRENLKFLSMDVRKVSLPPASFDIIVSFEVIEHLDDAIGYLSGISRLLKDNGLFAISTPNKISTEIDYVNDEPHNPLHVREYYPSEMLELLEKFFKVRSIYFQRFPDYMIEAHRQLNSYVRSTRIPRTLVRLTPRSLKEFWLKRKGISPPQSTKGKWREFEIAEVPGTQALTELHQVQIFLCEKVAKM